MSRNRQAGVMDPAMFERFSKGPEVRERMDEEIRKRFSIPDTRYYSVTMPPGPPGVVFVDYSRTRVLTTPKLSKSDGKPDPTN